MFFYFVGPAADHALPLQAKHAIYQMSPEGRCSPTCDTAVREALSWGGFIFGHTVGH
jgi:hypothetical protein